ncbi:Acg family FMN-binding oxidoreductase [Neolewinella antarctica]|uniref:Nitroreductase n=1 Tax=Neolewinella antarctica TaxID=442734 RepID=A0ABX0XDL7_9BACT|nr:nitroreductase family protein [Neolewinella antarctica]NJC26984.1 nitroreductase [Neolewinella antarctica]
MDRRKFLGVATGSVLTVGGAGYLYSDKHNVVRGDAATTGPKVSPPDPVEWEILYLASLAPSGHNTQPWFVKYSEPHHWIICNDKSRWLPAVDPNQRETMLSVGAFLQNLEYAASNAGYTCQFDLLAATNQDEDVVAVKLIESESAPAFDIGKIKHRRTVRSDYLNRLLSKEDTAYLFEEEKDFFSFIPSGAKEWRYLNEQTIEANRLQSYRNSAEKELSEWIRFSSEDAEKHRDGLTAASMEINGLPGWIVRNFYEESSVMKKGFRDRNIENVIEQVSQSAGWLLITSKDDSVAALLETGKRMQRLFLKVRERGIAIHPMTQILEESLTNRLVNQATGISDRIQFILRVGYVDNYPPPVSLRRPVDWFISAEHYS